MDQATLDLAREAVTTLRGSVTNYFEAKPQRAVRLDEFSGAVVPKGTSEEVLDVLAAHGIEVLGYNKAQEGSRLKAVEKLARALDKKRGDVLFSRDTSGDFGPVLTQYRGDAQGAIKALKELQNGEAVAALNHPKVGDIDLVWGKAGTNKHDGFGLSKLVKWHPEVLDDLQAIVKSMKVTQRSENRVQLESETHKGAVRLQWNGKSKHWLMTAFEKDVDEISPRTDTAGIQGKDDSLSDIHNKIVDEPASGDKSKNTKADLRKSFAGPKAQTAERLSLLSAQRQITEGADPETVRQDTGWHRGIDGRWRFEISDDQASVQPTATGTTFGSIHSNAQLQSMTAGSTTTATGLTVGDVLAHDPLYAAYPGLKDIPLGLIPQGQSATARLTRMPDGRHEVKLAGKVPRADIASAILHELQHAIQNIEGFAQGGSKRTPAVANIDQQAQQTQSQDLRTRSGASTYARLAGEIEARNTQARQSMTQAERSAIAPGFTADMADEQAIVTFNGRDVVNAPPPENAPAPPAAIPMTAARLKRAFAVQFPKLSPAIDRMLERGAKGQKGGVVVIDSRNSFDIARVFTDKTGRNFSESVQLFSDAGEINGFFDPKTGLTFLIGPNLDPITGVAVLLHEISHGQQRQGIDKRAMAMIDGRAKEANTGTRAFLDRVAGRMEDAGETGNAKEAAAYIVEQAVQEGRSEGFTVANGQFLAWVDAKLGKAVGDLVRSMLANVRAWQLRHGMAIGEITVDDLVGYAMVGAQRAAAGRVQVRRKRARADFSRGTSKVVTNPQFNSARLDAAGRSNLRGMERFGQNEGDVDLARRQVAGLLGAEFSFSIEVTQSLGSNTPGAFDRKSGRILLNANVRMSQAAMVEILTEETLHAIDSISATRVLSASSPRLREGGDIFNEAKAATGEIGFFLDYPLGSNLDQSRTAAELFARLGVVYHSNPEQMRQAMPTIYEVYHELFGLEARANQTDDFTLRARAWREAGPSPEMRGQHGASEQVLGRLAQRTDAKPPDSRLGRLRGAVVRNFEAKPYGAFYGGGLNAPGGINGAGVRGQDPSVSGSLQREPQATSLPLPGAVASVLQGSTLDKDMPLFSKKGTSQASAHNNIARQAIDTLNEAFASAPGKLSRWHTTVGSMYNLAERDPAFKRVFDAGQNFLGDVAYYGTQAADRAPTILPRLETLADMRKQPISHGDNRAIAAPIFQGTLSWTRDANGKPVRTGVVEQAGIVWTDAELAGIFNATPKQIALYKETRAAIDLSLDNAAKAEMLRYAGKDAADLKAMVMDAPDADTAAQVLQDFFSQMAADNPARADSLKETAEGVVERASKISSLKAKGYAPLSRFGKFTVDAVVNGKREYFSMFESARDANRMAERLGALYGKANVAQGTISEREFEQFQGVTPESMELFGNMLGLESTGDKAQDQAFQEYLKRAKNNRSAMKRLIHREGIAGYSEDVGRVLASFVYSNARQTAAALHMGRAGRED